MDSAAGTVRASTKLVPIMFNRIKVRGHDWPIKNIYAISLKKIPQCVHAHCRAEKLICLFFCAAVLMVPTPAAKRRLYVSGQLRFRAK